MAKNNNEIAEKKVIVKQFYSTKELYEWLAVTDMEEFKAQMKEKYGKNRGDVDLEEMQFVVTLKD